MKHVGPLIAAPVRLDPYSDTHNYIWTRLCIYLFWSVVELAYILLLLYCTFSNQFQGL